MLHPSKRERLNSIIKAYIDKYKVTSVKIHEIMDWADKHKLLPVPTNGWTVRACEAWESRLKEASK